MGVFDENGKCRPEDLRGHGGFLTGRKRKVTDESNERARVMRVESDTERSLNINPRTVDFQITEA